MAHAVGVRLEAITAAARVERIEDHDESIVGPQPLTVPARRRHDELRLAVVHARADVERVVVVEEIDLGRLGRRGAVAGSYLMEVGDDVGRLPNRFVELAVDDGRRRGADHADGLAGVGGGGCGALRARIGAEQRESGANDGDGGLKRPVVVGQNSDLAKANPGLFPPAAVYRRGGGGGQSFL